MTTEIKTVECPWCGGQGETMTAHMYPTGHTEVWSVCDECDGKGEIDEADYLMYKLSGNLP